MQNKKSKYFATNTSSNWIYKSKFLSLRFSMVELLDYIFILCRFQQRVWVRCAQRIGKATSESATKSFEVDSKLASCRKQNPNDVAKVQRIGYSGNTKTSNENVEKVGRWNLWISKFKSLLIFIFISDFIKYLWKYF